VDEGTKELVPTQRRSRSGCFFTSPISTAPAADPLSLSDPLSLQPRNHAHLPDLSGPGKPHNTAFKKSGRVRSWTAKQIAPQTDPVGGLT